MRGALIGGTSGTALSSAGDTRRGWAPSRCSARATTGSLRVDGGAATVVEQVHRPVLRTARRRERLCAWRNSGGALGVPTVTRWSPRRHRRRPSIVRRRARSDPRSSAAHRECPESVPRCASPSRSSSTTLGAPGMSRISHADARLATGCRASPMRTNNAPDWRDMTRGAEPGAAAGRSTARPTSGDEHDPRRAGIRAPVRRAERAADRRPRASTCPAARSPCAATGTGAHSPPPVATPATPSAHASSGASRPRCISRSTGSSASFERRSR